MKYKYIGINQFGTLFHIKEHPRKELMEQLGSKHADKMYIDGENGSRIHVGYVIAHNWIDVYKITPISEVK